MLLKCLLLFLLLAAAVAADCESDLQDMDTEEMFRDYLKQHLFLFLANPESRDQIINFTELNATLRFYFENEVNASTLCDNSIAAVSDINMTTVARKMLNLPDESYVPRCSDGTPYGKCSSTKPYYCYSGRLVPMCAGPSRDINTPGDDCGCPGDQDCCPDCGTGICDPECWELGELCNVSDVSYECEGQKVIQVTTGSQCIDYKCVPGLITRTEIRDCGELGRYCVSGETGCYECLTDEHCSKVYDGDFYCEDSTIKRKYGSGTCRTVTAENKCIGKDGPKDTETFATCTYPEQCVEGCGQCIDATTPHQYMSAFSDMGTMNIWLYLDYVSLNLSELHYNFTNVSVYEHRLDNSTGMIELVQVFESDPLHLATNCSISGCHMSWASTITEPGVYIYTGLVTNRSGTQWHIPNPLTQGYPGFCYGNVNVTI